MKKNKAKRKAPSEGLLEFDRRLKELGRYLPVTGALLVVNLVVWFFMVSRGVDWLDPSGDALQTWGANYGPLTTRGDGWRLMTACFLHAGLVQLLVNQWALWQYGRWLERFFGHLGFALLYLMAGFASSLAAVYWQPEAVLAGSTGAIAGLIGAFAAFYWRAPGVVPSLALNRLRASTFAFLGYNIGVDMYRQRLDAAGFLSGLAVGFIGGLILSQPLAADGRPRRFNRNATLAAAALLLVVFTAYLVRPDPRKELEEINALRSQAMAAYQAAINDYQADRIDDRQFFTLLGNDVLKPWAEAKRRLSKLGSRRLGGHPDELTRALKAMELREQGWNLVGDSIAAGSKEGLDNAIDKFAQADQIDDELSATFNEGETVGEKK